MEYLRIATLQRKVIEKLSHQVELLEDQTLSARSMLELTQGLAVEWDCETKGLSVQLKNCSGAVEFRKVIAWLEEYFSKIVDFLESVDCVDGAVDFTELASNTIVDMLRSLRLWEKQFAIEANIVAIEQTAENFAQEQ